MSIKDMYIIITSICIWFIVIPTALIKVLNIWCSCIVKTDKLVKVKSIFKVMKILNYSLNHKEVEISRYDFDIEKEEEQAVIYALGIIDSNSRVNTIEEISKLYDCIYLKIGNETFIIYYTKRGIINKIYYKNFIEKLSRRY